MDDEWLADDSILVPPDADPDGDFTYDGFVDILDAASFLSNGLFDAGAYNSAPSQAGAVAAVPEPTGLGAAVVALAAAMALRRRQSSRG